MAEHWAFNPQALGSSPSVPKTKNVMVVLNINYILSLTAAIFFIGLFGVILNRKNILTILMAIELLLLGINLNFAVLSICFDDIIGHVFLIFVLTVAAAESSIGLAIITVFYKLKHSIELEPIKKKLTNKV